MYKTKLQELCHQNRWGLPRYSSMKDGHDHTPLFKASVHSSVSCKSAKDAQNQAAMRTFLHFTSPPPPPSKCSLSLGDFLTSAEPKLAAGGPEIRETFQSPEIHSKAPGSKNGDALDDHSFIPLSDLCKKIEELREQIVICQPMLVVRHITRVKRRRFGPSLRRRDVRMTSRRLLQQLSRPRPLVKPIRPAADPTSYLTVSGHFPTIFYLDRKSTPYRSQWTHFEPPMLKFLLPPSPPNFHSHASLEACHCAFFPANQYVRTRRFSTTLCRDKEPANQND